MQQVCTFRRRHFFVQLSTEIESKDMGDRINTLFNRIIENPTLADLSGKSTNFGRKLKEKKNKLTFSPAATSSMAKRYKPSNSNFTKKIVLLIHESKCPTLKEEFEVLVPEKRVKHFGLFYKTWDSGDVRWQIVEWFQDYLVNLEDFVYLYCPGGNYLQELPSDVEVDGEFLKREFHKTAYIRKINSYAVDDPLVDADAPTEENNFLSEISIY